MRLALEEVGYTYAAGTSFAVDALQGVSMSVSRGALVLVLGATGSGKSTLLRVAAGLLTPTTGIVRVGDTPVKVASDVTGRVGMVFQSPQSQLFAETVESDVAFGPRNLGVSVEEAREAAREALDRVGLEWRRFGERSPFALSGGEAHRVAIAGVLAMRPEILLFDEPTAGLDADGRETVRAIVSGARARAGVVVVTHDAEEFLGVADEVILLAAGRVAFCGAPARLIDDPSLFEQAGLRVPEVLRAQMLARETGLPLGEFALDPARAAAFIAEARGRVR